MAQPVHVIGVSLDRLVLPTAVGKPFNSPYYALPAGAIDSLNFLPCAAESKRNVEVSKIGMLTACVGFADEPAWTARAARSRTSRS